MDTDRRRDLGEGYSFREEPAGGESVRAGPRPHHQRLRRRVRRNEVGLAYLLNKHRLKTIKYSANRINDSNSHPVLSSLKSQLSFRSIAVGVARVLITWI